MPLPFGGVKDLGLGLLGASKTQAEEAAEIATQQNQGCSTKHPECRNSSPQALTVASPKPNSLVRIQGMGAFLRCSFHAQQQTFALRGVLAGFVGLHRKVLVWLLLAAHGPVIQVNPLMHQRMCLSIA